MFLRESFGDSNLDGIYPCFKTGFGCCKKVHRVNLMYLLIYRLAVLRRSSCLERNMQQPTKGCKSQKVCFKMAYIVVPQNIILGTLDDCESITAHGLLYLLNGL